MGTGGEEKEEIGEGRPLSRRIPPPQPAGTLPRRRRRKIFGAPPRQPKFTDAAI